MKISLFLLVLCVAPRLAADCVSGTITVPDVVYKGSSGNVATFSTDAPSIGGEWLLEYGLGAITTVSADGKAITFRVHTFPNQVQIGLRISSCTYTVTVPVLDPPAPTCSPMTLTSPSMYTLPWLQHVSAPAAANTVTVDVQAACAWSVSRLPDWISVTSGASGNGNGTITLALQRNAGARGRTAVIHVNEREVTIRQQGVNSIYPDYNRDGKTDLLWRSTGGGSGLVFTSFMNGAATNGGRSITGEPDPAWNAYPAADLDQNGMSDLYWVRTGATGNVHDLKRVLDEYGVTTRESRTDDVILAGFADYPITTFPWVHYTHPSGGGIGFDGYQDFKIAAIADFDGNLVNDLLYRHATDGRSFVTLKPNDYDSYPLTANMPTEGNYQWQIAATGDVNGDGRADVIWRHADGRIWTMLMNGHASTPGAVVWVEPDPHWVLKGTGDFNGDGRADLLFRNDLSGLVFVVLLDGNNVLSAGVAHNEPNLNWHLVGPTNIQAMRAANSSSVP